jgi:hypothetical protein
LVVERRECLHAIKDSRYIQTDDLQTGYGVRYAVVALIFVGAYCHAQRRIRKGLQPLAYHRWLVRRRQIGPYPPQNNHAYYQQHDPAYPPQQGVPMQNMGGPHAYHQGGRSDFQPPPPAYGNWESPPVYQAPPQGASKVAANQHVQPVVGTEAVGEGSSASLPLNNPHHNMNNNNNNNHTQ